jgi:hypothetical protein
MSTSGTQAQAEFYVSNVAPAADTTTYVIVTDHPRSTAKIVQGYVVQRPGQDREYLNSQGEDAPDPVFRDQLDTAVDSYQAWAAKH